MAIKENFNHFLFYLFIMNPLDKEFMEQIFDNKKIREYFLWYLFDLKENKILNYSIRDNELEDSHETELPILKLYLFKKIDILIS